MTLKLRAFDFLVEYDDIVSQGAAKGIGGAKITKTCHWSLCMSPIQCYDIRKVKAVTKEFK